MEELKFSDLDRVSGGLIFLAPAAKAGYAIVSGMIGAYSLGYAIGKKL
jgi:lactobin A/cerein 7B family class IIb bacteriocin